MTTTKGNDTVARLLGASATKKPKKIISKSKLMSKPTGFYITPQQKKNIEYRKIETESGNSDIVREAIDFYFSLPLDLLNELKDSAQKSNTTVNDLLPTIIKNYLKEK